MGNVDDRFVIRVKNEGYLASLEPRKIFRVLPDDAAEGKGLLRIVDEFGEDYLFPADLLVPVDVPAEAGVAFVEPRR